MVRYLSTDPNAGREPAGKYLSIDPFAGMEEPGSTPISRAGAGVLAPINAQAALDTIGGAAREVPGVIADYAQGALKGLGRLAYPVVDAVGLGSDYADAALAPENDVEGAGGSLAQVGATGLATAALGGPLLAGAARLGVPAAVTRAAATPVGSGVVAAGTTKATGGTDEEAIRTGVLATVFGKMAGGGSGARPIPTGKGTIKPLPAPKPTVAQMKAAVEAGPRGNAAKQAMRAEREALKPKPAPEPAPTAPNPPAKPSTVPQTARDVDSAIKSLDKASQARLKHVVKQAQKEGADIKPGAPKTITTFRSGSEKGMAGTFYGDKIKEWPNQRVPVRKVELPAEGDGVTFLEGGKYSKDNWWSGVSGDGAGAPLAAQAWDGKIKLDPDLLPFVGKPHYSSIDAVDAAVALQLKRNGSEVVHILDPSRNGTVSIDLRSHTIRDLESALESASGKTLPKVSSYADDAAASAARQKQHIADSYAAKEAKDAANVQRSESLIPDLEQSAELLKKYPKRGGETSSQWMTRVRKTVDAEKSSPSAAQAIANDLAAKVQDLSTNQGLSRAQIKAILEQNHGIPSKHSSQLVNIVLGKKGK